MFHQRDAGAALRAGPDRVHLDAHEALAGFEHLFFSARLGVVKPEAAAFTTALTRWGLAPDEVTFVDDLPQNVSAAQEAGLGGICLTSAEDLGDQLPC